MKKIINTTPHSITLQDKDGHVYTVEPCGIVINASVVEKPAGRLPDGSELVKTCFVASPESEKALTQIEKDNPDAIIVGSIIASQAFPRRIYAMVPVEGFERVSPEQKRMKDYKFTTF